MKEFELKSIVRASAIYNICGMHDNHEPDFDDSNLLFLLSTADEFTYVGTDVKQFEFAMDEFEFLSEVQKHGVQNIEKCILEHVNSKNLNAKEFSYLVDGFLNQEMVA